MNYGSYDQVVSLFPIQPGPSQRMLVRWSKLKLFPAYIRPGSRKTTALWNIDEVQAWIEEKYSPLFATQKRNGNAQRENES